MSSNPETGPIVDTHVHFWDHSVAGLHWVFLEPGFTHPRLGELWRLDAPRYAEAELRAAIGDEPVARIVHIQAAKADDPTVETAWLQSMADSTGWPHAIVGYCNLASPDVAEVVAAHSRFPLFRGVRDLAAGDRLADPSVGRGFAALAPSGCPVELTTTHENYGHVASLMESHPEVPVVLGHSGLPVQRDDDYFASWSKAIATLAAETPAICKISALASGPDPRWTIDSIRRWFHALVESFGADRCMLGSNWPIDRQFGSYTRLLDAYRLLLGELSPADARAVASGTAMRFYRLAGPTAGSEPGLS